MDSKDIMQTNGEFASRKQRIKIRQGYDSRKAEKANEIKGIEDEIAKLNERKVQKLQEYNEINKEEYEKLAVMYNDASLISSIIRYGQHTTYSKTNLDDIKRKCEKGVNTDDVDLETLEKISTVEENINIEIKHTNILGDLLDKIGSAISFPGEEAD